MLTIRLLPHHTLFKQCSKLTLFKSASSSPSLLSRRGIHFDSSSGVSTDQLEYQQIAHNFSRDHFLPNVIEWDEHKIFPREQLQSIGELGFGGIYCSSEYGGSELSRNDARIIFESLARYDVSTTAYLSIHNMACNMIDKYGTAEQRSKYLPELTQCQKFASYCLTEPNAGSDAGNLQTKAILSDDKQYYILNGSKAFISGGSTSDVYVVMARTGDSNSGPNGISCFIVDKDSVGLSFGAQEKKLGWRTQPTCSVIMEDCRVPVDNLLGGIGNGFKIAMSGLDGGRLSIGTISIGAAIQCLNWSIDYVKQRKQFGAPLSTLQSVQFKIADMTIQLHAARNMIKVAAELLDSKDKNATMYCAMAKKYATDIGFNVCNTALQLHGGYGYIQEYHIERHLRDVRVHQILEGTNEVMQVIVSRQMLKD